MLGGPAELARWQPVLDELPELRKVILLEGAPDGDRFVSWDDFLALGRERLAADPAAIDARWQAVTAETFSPSCTPPAPPETPRACR